MELCAQQGVTGSLEEILKSPDHLQKNWSESYAALQQSLFHSVMSSQVECARILLEAGADVNFKVEESMTSMLSLAMGRQSSALVKLLLEYRPDLDCTDKDEDTALHLITGLTPVESVEAILKAGAKVDVLNKGNGTPLHMACLVSPLKIVKLLVEKGADPGQYGEGGTPLSKACSRWGVNYAPEREDVIRYLLDDCGVPPTSPMQPTEDDQEASHFAALTCSETIIKLFIEKGADMTMKDAIGRLPLHMACYNSLAAVEALGRPDTEYAAQDKVGRVPLHYAVMTGESVLVEYVINKTRTALLGIDVQDFDGWTPLLWAVRAESVFHWSDTQRDIPRVRRAEVLELLVRNGADPLVPGHVSRGANEKSQWSLMDIATYHSADDLVTTLAETHPNVKTAPTGGSRIIGDRSNIDLRYCDCCYLVRMISIDPEKTFTSLLTKV